MTINDAVNLTLQATLSNKGQFMFWIWKPINIYELVKKIMSLVEKN